MWWPGRTWNECGIDTLTLDGLGTCDCRQENILNCLVVMWPKTQLSDLLSTHDVATYIHNKFIEQLNDLNTDILVGGVFIFKQTKWLTKNTQAAPGKILTTADGWTANNTKESFLGMMAHCIEVRESKWKLQSEVVGFWGISGAHSGWNWGSTSWGSVTAWASAVKM